MEYLLAAGAVVFSVAAAAAPPTAHAQDARFASFVGAWERRDADLIVFAVRVGREPRDLNRCD